MDRLKQNFKHQLWLSLFFIFTVLISLLFNQIIVKADLIQAAKQSYILTFIVANSNQTFNDVAPLLLIVLLIKDMLFAVLVSTSVLIYVLLQRFIVKKIYGYIKITLMILLLLILYGAVILNLYLLSSIGIYSTLLIAENCLYLALLFLQTFFFVQFIKQYTRYRKQNNIPFISRKSVLNFAYTTIKNTFIISTVLIIVGIVLIVLFSKVSMYLVEQLALENYFSQVYQFDMMQLFQNVPPIMQKMILQIKANDLFYSVQNGVIIIDIHSIDYRIQTKMIELIRTNSIIMIDFLLKLMVASSVLFVSNQIYRKNEYRKFMLLLIMVGIMGVKVLFIRSTFILFVVCDTLYWVSLIIYAVNTIDMMFYDGELFTRIILASRKVINKDYSVFSKGVETYQKGKSLIETRKKVMKLQPLKKRNSGVIKKKTKQIHQKVHKRGVSARRKRRKRV